MVLYKTVRDNYLILLDALIDKIFDHCAFDTGITDNLLPFLTNASCDNSGICFNVVRLKV